MPELSYNQLTMLKLIELIKNPDARIEEIMALATFVEAHTLLTLRDEGSVWQQHKTHFGEKAARFNNYLDKDCWLQVFVIRTNKLASA